MKILALGTFILISHELGSNLSQLGEWLTKWIQSSNASAAVKLIDLVGVNDYEDLH